VEKVLYAVVAQQEGGSGGGEGQAEGQPQGCQQMSGMMLPILLMFVIIYFLIIRPQQKQQKRQREMIAALTKGDKIITNSGIFGTITGITDIAATLEIAKNVHIKVLRSHIAGRQPQAGEKTDGAPVVPGDEKKK
jgi:preprotein translocase subunit YajC